MTADRWRGSVWLRAIERSLVVVALLSLGWYAAVQTVAALDQAQWTRQLEQIRSSSSAAARTAGTSGSSGTTGPSIRATRVSRSLVGRLELPRLGLSAIVREGVDARTLRSAVGHIPDTALPGEEGNAAFAGHRDTFFRGLRNVRGGDQVVVTTPDGVFNYIVRETRIVKPTDASALEPTSKPTLTLITCYPFDYIGFAPKRFIVRATMAVPDGTRFAR